MAREIAREVTSPDRAEPHPRQRRGAARRSPHYGSPLKGSSMSGRSPTRADDRAAHEAARCAAGIEGPDYLEFLVEDSPEAHIALSPDGTIRYWNRGAQALFGRRSEDAVGRAFVDLVVPPEGREEMAHALAQVIGSGSRVVRTSSRRGDGSEVLMEAMVKSVRSADGRLRFIAIRERERYVSESLRRTEAQAADAMFRGLLEAAPDAMMIARSDSTIALVNGQLHRMFGYEREELLGKPVEILVPDRFRGIHLQHRERYFGEPRTRPMGAGLDLQGRRKDGSEFPVEISLSPMRTDDGTLVTAAIRDISERKLVETRLRTSLNEKEVLLKEVHHRVKNSLQIVSSMLALQMRQVTSPQAIELLKESQTRIRSIALLHEKLYQSPSLARVDIPGYLRGIATELMGTYGVTDQVALSVGAEDLRLGMDAAISCGLIVNELLSNALKHAFPGGRRGTVRVILRREGEEVVLEVTDDGVGFPPGIDFHHPDTLGLKLVCMLTEQIRGTIELERREGTKFVIRFAQGADA